MIKGEETNEQIAVVDFCDLAGIPVVHIPNEGKRSQMYGGILKRMGLRKGFPDLFVTCARLGYHGLFVEMKSKRGKPTEDQLIWLRRLTDEGYACAICYSADDAIRKIKKYMGG